MTSTPSTSGSPAAEVVSQALAGRREASLLAAPSVARMAELIAVRCRDSVWVRTCVVTLDRFRVLVADGATPEGLATLLEAARHNVAVAEDAMLRFYEALPPCTDTQLAALAVGPKVWFRVNGVDLPWRPPEGPVAVTRQTGRGRQPAEDPTRLLLLSMINSGLSTAEAVSLRMGDAGGLGPDGALVADRHADPLAVSFQPEDTTDPAERSITFLNFEARAALGFSWAARVLAGEELADDAPLIAGPDGSVDPGTVDAARSRHEALIGAGHEVNLFMCRMTGDFFREWGMPGSRFLERNAAVEPQAPTDQE
jgi:hypothetical protein